MTELEEIAEILLKYDHYLILGHEDPDGDCIGSVFGLKWILDQLGKTSLVLMKDNPEDYLDFLPLSSVDYYLFKNFSLNRLNWPKVTFIALDTGTKRRLGLDEKILDNHLLINIDHHPDNPAYGDINYIDYRASSAGEIIYNLLPLLNLSVSDKIGIALAAAIICDTGGLRYQNTTARVYGIMAELVESGIDLYKINQWLYCYQSFASVKLKGLVLSTLSLSKNKKIAWIIVEQSSLKKAGAEKSDTSGLVSYPRDIKGIEVGLAFFELEDGRWRVSLRSNNYCPVNEIAACFGGGGHDRAAACIIDKSLAETKSLVLNKVEEYV